MDVTHTWLIYSNQFCHKSIQVGTTGLERANGSFGRHTNNVGGQTVRMFIIYSTVYKASYCVASMNHIPMCERQNHGMKHYIKLWCMLKI